MGWHVESHRLDWSAISPCSLELPVGAGVAAQSSAQYCIHSSASCSVPLIGFSLIDGAALTVSQSRTNSCVPNRVVVFVTKEELPCPRPLGPGTDAIPPPVWSGGAAMIPTNIFALGWRVRGGAVFPA